MLLAILSGRERGNLDILLGVFTLMAGIGAIARLAHSRTIMMIAHGRTTVGARGLIYMPDSGRMFASGTCGEPLERGQAFRSTAASGGQVRN